MINVCIYTHIVINASMVESCVLSSEYIHSSRRYIRARAHTHIDVCIYTHIVINASMCVRVCACIYWLMCVYTDHQCVYVYVCVCTDQCVYIHTYSDQYINVCMCTCVYILTTTVYILTTQHTRLYRCKCKYTHMPADSPQILRGGKKDIYLPKKTL